MVISELAYRFSDQNPWLPIVITANTGTFNEKTKDTDAGILYTTEVSAYLPNITPDNDTLVNTLVARPALYRITDTAGIVHEIGEDTARASLEYEKINEGKPGAKHGYSLKFNLLYSKPSKIQVL
jgi:hypothetical protein